MYKEDGMGPPLRVLLIEDSEDDAKLIERTLRRGGFEPQIERVYTPHAMTRALDEGHWDIVISDYMMPSFSVPAALAMLKLRELDLPFIIVSGAIVEQTAVDAMRSGAHDYVMKDNLTRLVPAIEREIIEATGRKQRRQAEAISARLGRILDNSQDEIYIFDPDSLQFIQVNRGAFENLGYSEPELRKLTLPDIQPRNTPDQLLDLLSPLVKREREQISFETEHQRKDGSIYPVAVKLYYSGNETPPVVVAIVENIAERKQAEAALQFIANASSLLAGSLAYETTFQNLVELAIPYLADLCIIDTVENDQVIRRIAVAHINLSKEVLVNRLQQITPDPERPHPAVKVIRTGQPEINEHVTDELLETIARDNEHFEILRSLGYGSHLVLPLVARDHTLGAISFISMESRQHTTREIALAEELARRAATAIDNAQLYRAAQQALEIRDHFLSIAAHELKTPITALLGHAQLLQQRLLRTGQFEAREYRMLEVITEQALRLANMVEVLLDVGRLRTGALAMDTNTLDLSRLVQRVVGEIEPGLEHHALHLRIPGQPILITGDEMRLEQVIQNLVQNAIKYSPHGGEIFVRLESIDGRVCISVADHGIGIPPQALADIFRQFYRADNVNQLNISGFGLGLYVVSEIVSMHNGTVDVESIEGKGSTFRVYLPANQGLSLN
jgi:PAS domain S-box-containing protein